MAGFNQAIILGNLGGDPEAKYTADGKMIANFSVATSRQWMKDGEKKEETEWHRVVCFGRTAEIATQFLSKGKPVLIIGRIHHRQWEDKETGQRRYGDDIICNELQLVGSRGDGGGGVSADAYSDLPEAQQSGRAARPKSDAEGVDPDDLPFV